MSEVIFQSERLRFRKCTVDDRADFREINADPLVMEHFPSVLTTEESDALVGRMIAHQEKKGFGLYVAERIDHGGVEFIGFIGLATPRFELEYGPDWVEIGWRTKPSSWGVGLASEGALRVLEYAFDELKLETVFSMTSTTNKRSERVMQKIGMEHIGFIDHPLVPADSHLSRHTLYQIHKPR